MQVGKKRKFSGMILPIMLLVFAIVSTIGVYAYNMYLEGKNEELVQSISGINMKIQDVKKDPNLQVYNLITSNKKLIEKIKSHSQVTTFIERMSLIEEKYSVVFDGFTYSNGVIASQMTTSPDSSLPPYKIVSSFIQGYRGDPLAYFTLPFISQVTGSSKMQMNVKFNVKDILPSKEATIKKNKSKKEEILEKMKEKTNNIDEL